jgi:hypothetical protein
MHEGSLHEAKPLFDFLAEANQAKHHLEEHLTCHDVNRTVVLVRCQRLPES